MKLIPVITEKTTLKSKEGIYTFLVDPRLTKGQIKDLINKTFNVHVVKIRVLRKHKVIKKNYLGRKKVFQAEKKAEVKLKEKEKIELFEVKGGKKQ